MITPQQIKILEFLTMGFAVLVLMLLLMREFIFEKGESIIRWLELDMDAKQVFDRVNRRCRR